MAARVRAAADAGRGSGRRHDELVDVAAGLIDEESTLLHAATVLHHRLHDADAAGVRVLVVALQSLQVERREAGLILGFGRAPFELVGHALQRTFQIQETALELLVEGPDVGTARGHHATVPDSPLLTTVLDSGHGVLEQSVYFVFGELDVKVGLPGSRVGEVLRDDVLTRLQGRGTGGTKKRVQSFLNLRLCSSKFSYDLSGAQGRCRRWRRLVGRLQWHRGCPDRCWHRRLDFCGNFLLLRSRRHRAAYSGRCVGRDRLRLLDNLLGLDRLWCLFLLLLLLAADDGFLGRFFGNRIALQQPSLLLFFLGLCTFLAILLLLALRLLTNRRRPNSAYTRYWRRICARLRCRSHRHVVRDVLTRWRSWEVHRCYAWLARRQLSSSYGRWRRSRRNSRWCFGLRCCCLNNTQCPRQSLDHRRRDADAWTRWDRRCGGRL